MGYRMEKVPTCDITGEDVPEGIRRFHFQLDGGPAYVVELCPVKMATLTGYMRDFMEKGTRLDAATGEGVEVVIATDDAPPEPEPVEELPGEIPPAEEPATEFPGTFSACNAEQRAKIRVWWHKNYVRMRLRTPPEVNRGIVPKDVMAAWTEQQAKERRAKQLQNA